MALYQLVVEDYHGDLVVGDIMKQSYDEILNGKGLLENFAKKHEIII